MPILMQWTALATAPRQRIWREAEAFLGGAVSSKHNPDKVACTMQLATDARSSRVLAVECIRRKYCSKLLGKSCRWRSKTFCFCVYAICRSCWSTCSKLEPMQHGLGEEHDMPLEASGVAFVRRRQSVMTFCRSPSPIPRARRRWRSQPRIARRAASRSSRPWNCPVPPSSPHFSSPSLCLSVLIYPVYLSTCLSICLYLSICASNKSIHACSCTRCTYMHAYVLMHTCAHIHHQMLIYPKNDQPVVVLLPGVKHIMCRHWCMRML